MKKELLLFGLLLLSSAFVFSACSDDDESEFVGNWKKVGDFDGVGRSYAVTFTIGANVYVATGVDNKDYLNDLWMLDPTTLSWTQRASIGVEGEEAVRRGYSVGFALGNAGYVGLGYTSDAKYLRDFWKFDQASNSWTKLNDFGGAARFGAVAFVANNKAYVGTGYDGNHLKDFWRYEPTTDSWTQIATYNGSKRRGASTFNIGNDAYLVCGENNGQGVNDFWRFNAADETWTELRKIANVSTDAFDDDYNIVRRYGASFVMGGKAYIACGDLSNTMRKDTWEYDPATDLWEQLTSFEGTARTGALGLSLNGRGYVTTGRSSSYYFDDMFEFFPTEEYDEYD